MPARKDRHFQPRGGREWDPLVLRTTLSLLYRSILLIIIGAGMVAFAQSYGVTLASQFLPSDMRPSHEDVAKMTPNKVMEALREIGEALE